MVLGADNTSTAELAPSATVQDLERWLKKFPRGARVSGTINSNNDRCQLKVSWYDITDGATIGD